MSNRSYHELLDALSTSPIGEWHAVSLDHVTGDSSAAKQATILSSCYRRWQRGALQTHLGDKLLHVRLVPDSIPANDPQWSIGLRVVHQPDKINATITYSIAGPKVVQEVILFDVTSTNTDIIEAVSHRVAARVKKEQDCKNTLAV
jgi:hypothetical protein